ncbi:MAG: excinuclease ABC subunit UvrA [Flavobacteriales bacterium]|nr:excinuclease ABC subunit UvrA [Flavobacteriales bacterium]
MDSTISIYGAREHNLKNIDVKIPRDELVVFTGLSGSGKSSLAFDTIFAEGQRRYIETFSAYARQFLGNLDRPDVDKIEGLSPVIAIEQKTTNKNPRSTVGTITEIYDFLRLLYARVADAYSYNTGEKMVRYTPEKILQLIQTKFQGKRIAILAPLVRSRKGHYRELFESYYKKGFTQFRIDGKMQEATRGMMIDRFKTHDIELVIDKLIVNNELSERFVNSLELAMDIANGMVLILDYETQNIQHYSKFLMCPTTGISYQTPEPNSFSFNSPKGACSKCKGLGEVQKIDLEKIIINKKAGVLTGGLSVTSDKKYGNYIIKSIETILKINNYKQTTPFYSLNKETQDEILYGVDKKIHVELKEAQISKKISVRFEGIIPLLENFSTQENLQSKHIQKNYITDAICPKCNGGRLKKESLHFKIAEKNISEATRFSLIEFQTWLKDIENHLSDNQKKIATEIIKEIATRLQFLLEVGLDYLTLDRSSKTLSGGESQRIRLATQIGSQLTNVLYILDEPSIGLHQRDNVKLIESLKKLRDIGNSVLVVEHDKDMILESDYIFDIGPFAGKNGGEIIWEGTPNQLEKAKTLTSEYIQGTKQIEIPNEVRKGNGKFLKLENCTGNNLKSVTLTLPLGKLIGVSGVSGSGKSTLINHTLYPILNQHFYKSDKIPLPYKKISGIEYLDKIVDVDQSPIGRTPRSNPATYTGVFSDIRALFANLPESKIRGYKVGRFSFNVKGGRCETCEGAGLKMIEMNFLPDIYVHCESCYGKRFNRETLEVRYKGKSIADVLDMTIDDASVFFQPIPKIYNKIKTLQEVGLGYISLGQQSTTLSGGEAQRVKLATELSKKQTGKTIYLLDEPTTGLHFQDVKILMDVIHTIVNQGNTVVIIEHNLDVLKVCDYLIDIGPEGGSKGGKIVAEGTPQEIANNKKSYTGIFLKKEMGLE